MKFELACCLALMAMGCGGAFQTPDDRGDSGLGGGAVGGGAGRGGSAGMGGSTGSGGTPVVSDAGVDWSACDGPGQCVALQSTCCSPCGTPELPTFAGVNQKYAAAYAGQRCAVAVACPACATSTNPNIAAHCVQGHCQAFDVRTTAAYSSCTATDQCALRAGLGCCECGATGWVSVSLAGRRTLSMDMCAGSATCAQCAPVPPANALAICSSGFCQLSALQ